MTNRAKWVAAAVGVLAVLVILVWIFGGAVKDAGDDDEDTVPSAAPKISHTSGGDSVVELSLDEQARIGLKTESLTAVTQSRDLAAYGVVLDPAPLATLSAEVASSRATLQASRAEYQRARLLHSEQQNVSRKDFETARAKFQADQAQFDLVNLRLADEWGANIAAMTPEERAGLIVALTQRVAGLIRISLPPGQSFAQEPAQARVTAPGFDNRPLITHSIWFAPTVDSHLQGQSFLMRVDGQGLRFRPGTAITAHLDSQAAAQSGVVIPEAAIVRTSDRAWVYVQIAPIQFERRPLVISGPASPGWFVTSGFAAGDHVVITGAQALLSEELKSQIQVGD